MPTHTSLRLLASRRKLGFEFLERREVLSGNVTATIQDGNLVITGDAANNNIVISGGAVGEVVVAGGSDAGVGTETMVNSGLTAVALTGFTGDILIDMRGGNDRVLITSIAAPGVISATLGTGNDTFAMQSRSVSAQPFTLNAGLPVTYGTASSKSVFVSANVGNDELAMYDMRVDGDVIFYGGDGDDTFTAEGLATADNFVARAVLIDMGWGEDTITATRTTIGDSLLIYDGGATVGSTVTLTSLSVDRSVRMYLSIMADTVVIRGTDNGVNRFRTDDLVVFTGDTADDVTIENAVLSNLTVDTGAGDEGNGFFGIELRNLAVAYNFWVNSGDGFDNILIEDSTGSVIRVFGGNGSDGMIARNITAFDAVYDSGELGDVVGLYDSDYERLVVGLFGGMDSLYAGNLTVSRAATFDGGADDDTFIDRGGNSFVASNKVSIENNQT